MNVISSTTQKHNQTWKIMKGSKGRTSQVLNTGKCNWKRHLVMCTKNSKYSYFMYKVKTGYKVLFRV